MSSMRRSNATGKGTTRSTARTRARAVARTAGVVAVAGIVSLAGACGTDDDGTGDGDRADSAERAERQQAAQEPVAGIGEVRLERLAVDIDAPMDAHPLGDSLLVAERAGRVKELVDDGGGGYEVAGTVVDLREDVGSTDSEKGLLGLTTDPDGTHLYVNHTRAADGATVVLELPLDGGPGSLSAGEPRELLVIEQPYTNHNGGDLAWGPDGMLWTGTGDGGSGGDPEGRAQRLDTLLGKVLRIDPSLPGSGGDLSPVDNPYAGDTADVPEGAEPLIWARGLRNPWRISFDDDTGDLWIADVGQNRIEEVSVLRASEGLLPGADLGWDRLEGDEPFDDPGPTDGWPDDDAPVVDPVHTYVHDPGCSVTGGFVYRGTALAGLGGHYLFSDYCDGTVRALAPDGTPGTLSSGGAVVGGSAVVSISADGDGEPLVLDNGGLSRLVPA